MLGRYTTGPVAASAEDSRGSTRLSPVRPPGALFRRSAIDDDRRGAPSPSWPKRTRIRPSGASWRVSDPCHGASVPVGVDARAAPAAATTGQSATAATAIVVRRRRPPIEQGERRRDRRRRSAGSAGLPRRCALRLEADAGTAGRRPGRRRSAPPALAGHGGVRHRANRAASVRRPGRGPVRRSTERDRTSSDAVAPVRASIR